MARNETNPEKIKYSYGLTKQRKFFRKARAIVIKDGKLLAIRIDYNNGKHHYLLPGGGVDDNETIKDAMVRETLEEYNAVVVPTKYLDKQYYNIPLEYNGEKFVSHRIDYYYICEFKNFSNNTEFGIGEEFKKDDRTYTKVELSLEDVLKEKPQNLNSMCERTYKKLVFYMKTLL